MSRKTYSRRDVLAGSAAAGATVLLAGKPAAAADGKKLTFTILHTNDLHSNLIGMGPASDYTPFKLNDDKTQGGFARLATLIAQRKEVRKDQGPVLILDAGDYSMGTAFGSAIRETGAELQLLSQMGYDATTLGNHDFDLGPMVWARRSAWPPKQVGFRRWSLRTPTSRQTTQRWTISSVCSRMG